MFPLPHFLRYAYYMSKVDDLDESIQKLIKDYPNKFSVDDLFETDQIRIRRKTQNAENVKQDDIVGIYSEDDYADGKITKDTIRKDLQAWLQKHGSKI